MVYYIAVCLENRGDKDLLHNISQFLVLLLFSAVVKCDDGQLKMHSAIAKRYSISSIVSTFNEKVAVLVLRP